MEALDSRSKNKAEHTPYVKSRAYTQVLLDAEVKRLAPTHNTD